MISLLLSSVCLLAALGMFALLCGAETAALAANRRIFREAQTSGDQNAGDVMALFQAMRRILHASMGWRALFAVIGVAAVRGAGLALAPQWGGPSSRFPGFSPIDWLTLVLAPALFLAVGEGFARARFRAHADTAIRGLALPLAALSSPMAPVVKGIQAACDFCLGARNTGESAHTIDRDDLARLFGVNEEPPGLDHPGVTAPVLDAEGRSMIHNIVDLDITRAREIMRPLIDVTAIRLGMTDIEGLKELARRTGYSKFPVFRNRVIHLEGFVSVYDVLKKGNGPGQQLEDFIHQAYYVPESMRANDLLRVFLELRLAAAIVIDEHGACSGWITREDLLEELVGEFEDEFDPREPVLMEALSDGGWLCDGQVDIDDLNEKLDAHFPKDGFETLGGWIYDALGRVPALGAAISFEDYLVEVESMNGPAIKKVRIRIKDRQDD